MGRTGAAKRVSLLAAGTGLALAARAALRRGRAYDLAGAVVLITGGSRGLGLALAEAFAARGARLAICARNPQQLEEARARLAAGGAEVIAIQCDISDRAQVGQLVEQVNQRYGRLDVLVNNAGTIAVGPLDVQTVADFELAMATMFWGTLYATLAALPGMRERGRGRIVNIASIGGRVSVPHLTPYSAAKFAVVGLSEGLRAELAGTGVGVVTVSPGLMRTGSYVNALFKGDHRAEYAWFALGDSLPVTSMDVARAARRIVQATINGDAELTLTPQAIALARLHGLAPGPLADLLGLVNRLLPKADAADWQDSQAWLGRESETALTRSFLTTLGRQAAVDYNQHPANGEDRLLDPPDPPPLWTT